MPFYVMFSSYITLLSSLDRAIRHRACLLKDIALAIIEDDLDPDFEKRCNEVIEARKRRKANPLKFAPRYYKVLPKPSQLLQPIQSTANGKIGVCLAFLWLRCFSTSLFFERVVYARIRYKKNGSKCFLMADFSYCVV